MTTRSNPQAAQRSSEDQYGRIIAHALGSSRRRRVVGEFSVELEVTT